MSSITLVVMMKFLKGGTPVAASASAEQQLMLMGVGS